VTDRIRQEKRVRQCKIAQDNGSETRAIVRSNRISDRVHTYIEISGFARIFFSLTGFFGFRTAGTQIIRVGFVAARIKGHSWSFIDLLPLCKHLCFLLFRKSFHATKGAHVRTGNEIVQDLWPRVVRMQVIVVLRSNGCHFGKIEA